MVVDNITIDGTTIALSSGDLTLDIAGDMIIDVDGGAVKLFDGGTQYAFLNHGGSDKLSIKATIQDADIGFFGNDGGAEITALLLDMSDAGTAIFNHDIQMADSSLIRMGAGGDLILSSDGTNGAINANEGNLTFDVAGDITFDADGDEVFFKRGGVAGGRILMASAMFAIGSQENNGDFKIMGGDPSTTTERFRVQPNGNVSIGGTASGGTPNLEFYHNDSLRGFIRATDAAGLLIDSDSALTFNTNNTARWAIGSSGHITPNNQHSFDIGGVNAEVRNIYAQGLYVGGSAAANKLDDYEEGTFTGAVGRIGANATADGYSVSAGRYVKVGKMVTAWVNLKLSGANSGGTSAAARITGLPFAGANYGSFKNPQVRANIGNLSTDVSDKGVMFYVEDSAASMQGRIINNADTILPSNYIQNTSYITLVITYDTA